MIDNRFFNKRKILGFKPGWFFIALIYLSSSFAFVGTGSQSPEVPADIQYLLFTKILSYDRNLPLKSNTKGELVVGVIFQGKYRESLTQKDEFVAAMNKSAIHDVNGKKLKIQLINLDEQGSLKSFLQSGKIATFYVTALRSADINVVVAESRKEGIMTFTGIPAYVEKGLSVSVELVGGRPSILINNDSAKLEKCDFSSQLLKISRIVK